MKHHKKNTLEFEKSVEFNGAAITIILFIFFLISIHESKLYISGNFIFVNLLLWPAIWRITVSVFRSQAKKDYKKYIEKENSQEARNRYSASIESKLNDLNSIVNNVSKDFDSRYGGQ